MSEWTDMQMLKFVHTFIRTFKPSASKQFLLLSIRGKRSGLAQIDNRLSDLGILLPMDQQINHALAYLHSNALPGGTRNG